MASCMGRRIARIASFRNKENPRGVLDCQWLFGRWFANDGAYSRAQTLEKAVEPSEQNDEATRQLE